MHAANVPVAVAVAVAVTDEHQALCIPLRLAAGQASTSAARKCYAVQCCAMHVARRTRVSCGVVGGTHHRWRRPPPHRR